MKIALSEIWNFISLVSKDEKGWSYSLHAGSVTVSDISSEMMRELQRDQYFDTELLPSLFTFREILWQPDVFTEKSMSLPPLRILKAFCAETLAEMNDENNKSNAIYGQLIKGIGKCTAKAISSMDKDKADVKKILGDFRLCAFPIIKFFISHPQNRNDYLMDATNRLNYAVKIMLTQFHGKYTDLKDPYWKVKYTQAKSVKKISNSSSEQ